ncbi:MAG TPA: saccharopine dehydrogenase C-terminal domain-containing protein [Methanomassiliicoccales archaeon]|nr:saccharopine dehydrogenase C-terminal domain-containing protein [Methanomassiliicoccales archaeon]
MMEFDGKVLIIGYGSVARCTLPILLKHVEIPYSNITIIDFENKSSLLRQWTSRGVKYRRQRITPENIDSVLSAHLAPGGLLIDLAWNLDTGALIRWCHEHDVLFVNTSLEIWDSTSEIESKDPVDKSLYCRQMRLKELTKGWDDGTTAVIDHGANPGLISHFVKQALIDISERLIAENKVSREEGEHLRALVKTHNYAELSMALDVKVIHCSERDTQISRKPKHVDEFVGTWSIEGLREEGTAPAEIGWGTHEKTLPPLAFIPSYGSKNQIMLAQMGMNTWIRSWVPDCEIVGMAIRHGEAFGLSDKLTVWRHGDAIYRPTVCYSYMPCDGTLASLHELRCRNYEMQPKLRILNEKEIISGADMLGALLMGHEYGSWWCGSVLTIEEARRLAPGQNATTVQVALGIISAIMWMIEHPHEGLCTPEDLPHDYVLKIARPYLGTLISMPSNWTPHKNRKVYFKENPANHPDEDIWQFKNFVFVP